MKSRNTSFAEISNRPKMLNLNLKTNKFITGLKPVVLVFFMVLFAFVPMLSAAPVTIDDDVQDPSPVSLSGACRSCRGGKGCMRSGTNSSHAASSSSRS